MTESKSFAIVSFCEAEQISTILKVLRSKTMSWTDAPGDSKSYQGNVFEAVWLKSGHRFHHPARGGGLGRDCEFVVIGLFVDKEVTDQDTLRSLFNILPNESSSNV